MNNPFLSNKNIYSEVSCSDPDKDFEILDDISIGNNSESLKQKTTTVPSSSTCSTNNADNNIYDSLYDIHFDKTAVEMAKLYANSTSQTDINWLASELDTISNEESSWNINNYQENELDIELSSSRTKYINSTCILIDDLNGTSQRCSQSISKPLRQLDQHYDDSTKSLQFLSKWINDISESAEKNTRCLLLDKIFRGIMAFFEKLKLAKLNKEENISNGELENDTIKNDENNKNRKKTTNLLSFLGIKIAFRLKKVNIKKFFANEVLCNTIKKHPAQMGEALANIFWRSRPEIRANKKKLEMPSSLKEYYDGFPLVLSNFFYGLINTIQQNKWKVVVGKQKERGILEKDYDDTRAKKIALFFASVLLSITFPGLNVCSLCQKPRLHTSLYTILYTAGVVAHTNRYEKHLEKQRRKQVNIVEKLWVGEDIWNICIVDNFDLQESTFSYNNLYNITRKTAHITLRMVWQYRFPQAISNLIKSNDTELLAFRIGRSTFIDQQIQNLEKIFHLFVEDKWLDYE
ncbi:19395_t:CDS:2, partial [Gigaspora margarita]